MNERNNRKEKKLNIKEKKLFMNASDGFIK